MADSVNPIEVTRAAWRGAATRAGAPFVEIEVTCSDFVGHRARLESRDTVRLRIPDLTGEEVQGREYEPWEGAAVPIDTAGQSVAGSVAILRGALDEWNGR